MFLHVGSAAGAVVVVFFYDGAAFLAERYEFSLSD